MATGQYNETVFRGVDYAIAQANRYNLKVILALGTNWDFQDGVPGVRSFTALLYWLLKSFAKRYFGARQLSARAPGRRCWSVPVLLASFLLPAVTLE